MIAKFFGSLPSRRDCLGGSLEVKVDEGQRPLTVCEPPKVFGVRIDRLTPGVSRRLWRAEGRAVDLLLDANFLAPRSGVDPVDARRRLRCHGAHRSLPFRTRDSPLSRHSLSTNGMVIAPLDHPS
jgi:hypothetical protein